MVNLWERRHLILPGHVSVPEAEAFSLFDSSHLPGEQVRGARSWLRNDEAVMGSKQGNCWARLTRLLRKLHRAAECVRHVMSWLKRKTVTAWRKTWQLEPICDRLSLPSVHTWRESSVVKGFLHWPDCWTYRSTSQVRFEVLQATALHHQHKGVDDF